MRILLMALVVALFYGCEEKEAQPEEMTQFIPDHSAVILQLQNPDLFFSNLKNNDFFRKNRDFVLHQELHDGLALLDHFTHKDPAYLSLSGEKGKLLFSFISKGVPKITLDSVQNKMVETLTTGDRVITKYTLEERIAYTATRDDIYIISNSKELLEKALKGNSEIARSPDFRKALRAASDKMPVIYFNHQEIIPLLKNWFPGADLETLYRFSNWSVLDAEISQSAIKLNGITSAQDSVSHPVNIFRGVEPSENRIARVTPSTSQGFYSISFEHFAPLHENLRNYNQNNLQGGAASSALLETASEAGIILQQEGRVLAVRTLDQDAARRAMAAQQELLEEFRGVSLFKFDQSFALFSPLLEAGDLQVYAHLDDFVLFSSTKEALQSVIISFQNDAVLSEHEAYQKAMTHLSSEASLLLVANNPSMKKIVAKAASQDLDAAIKALNFDDYPLSALQFIYEDDFAHVHAVMTKNEAQPKENSVSQIASVKLDAALVSKPVFFKNHRSEGMDIAVQDANNTLYLISPEGRIYWKKQLESRILGEIQSVDILRNGRYQLAFATANRIHVIDRTGKPVQPFPLDFKDEITQPLAVFDYDNNRKYRFVIVQDRELFMFNNQGQSVRGFKFRRADNSITHPPKHIRIGRKDYILVSETSGKLNILSRTGKTRVPVHQNFDFSNNEWFEYQGKFMSTTENGELITISEEGKVERKDLNLGPNHYLAATVKRFVTLSDNILVIKEQEIPLDFGLYTAPEIFYINNKIYVGVTDTQAHKVYLFDSNGSLFNGFPVYGNSTIDLSNADSDTNPELVVQGAEGSILIYEIR